MGFIKLVATLGLLIAWIGAGFSELWADETKSSPDELTVIRDLRYRDIDSKSCTLDLALPRASAAAARPAILVIHGGGWLEGDKSSFVVSEKPVPGNIQAFARLGF